MSQLQDKTVVLDVTFHKPGRFRKGNLSNVDIDADKDSLRLSKDVIQSSHYIACEGVQRRLDAFLRTRRLKAPFRRGVYLIPVGCVEEVYKRLEEAKAEFNQEADSLVEEWPTIREKAERKLRSQFDEKTFPTAERIRNAMSMEWKLLKFSVPDSESVGDVLAEIESQKAEKSWVKAEQEVTLALRQSLNELLGHLSTKLTESADGSKKVLKQSAVDKVWDFLESFSKRNVMNDEEMETLVQKARNLFDGKKADDFRNNKQSTAVQIKKLENQLETMIDEQKREFDFDV